MRGLRRTSLVLLLALVAVISGPAREHDEEWVSQKVKQIRESDTKGWRRIAWTASLLAARKASQKENQPIFLFTHDGNIDTGRC